MIVVKAQGFTDIGRQRQDNEDGFGVWLNEGLFAVCDGMGGCHGGDVATQLALQALLEGFCVEVPPGGYRTNAGLRGLERLGAAVRLANRRVFEKANGSNFYMGIGAAIAAISIEEDRVFIAHVGDCRVYRHRASRLEPLTRDHSLVNDWLKFKPDATEEEIAAVPKNVITRAIGLKSDVAVELHHEYAIAGDLYLLCTDGIHGLLDDVAIANILQANTDLAQTAKTLLDAALEAGGTDNIAAVLVQFSSD